MVIEVNKATGEETEIGLFDRDQGERMVAMDMAIYYTKEVKPSESLLKTQAEWIDKVLADAKRYGVDVTRDAPNEYTAAVELALTLKLIEKGKSNYTLTEKGLEVINTGGYQKWEEISNMTEWEWIDHILDVTNRGVGGVDKDSPRAYKDAFYKAIRLGLITDDIRNPKLKAEADKAMLVGTEKWNEDKKKRQFDLERSPTTINYHGPVNNSPLFQDSSFRDLNNLSPIKKNEPQKAQSVASQNKKTDHSIWDKIKYISVIVGGLGAFIAAIGKLLHWW